MYIIQIHIHIHIHIYTYTYTLICSFLYVSIYSGGLGLLLALGLLLCKPQPLHDNHSHQVPCNMKGVLKPPQDTFYILAKNIKTNGDASKSLVHFLNCFSVAACVFVIDLCSSTVVPLVLRFLKIKAICTQILLWIYIYMFICIKLVWGYYLAWGYCFANQNQNLCMTTRYLVK